MTTLRFTDADRDERGRIRIQPERQLAELLPPLPSTPSADAPAEAPAAAPRQRIGARQLQTIAGLGVGGAIAIVLAVILGRGEVSPPRPIPAAAPSAPAAPPASPAAPTDVPAAPVAERTIPAYWAPGRDPAPAIGATTPYTPTGVYGETWVHVRLPGGGEVWIARGDAEARGALPDALPDLSPPTPAPPPPPPPPAPRVVERVVVATPVPNCLTAGTDAQLVTVCGEPGEDLQTKAAAAWVAKYGGHVGTVRLRPTLAP